MSAREDNFRHYEAIAAHFDTTYNRENSNHLYKIEQISDELFANLAPAHSWEILELGGGTGIHAYHFLQANKHRNINFTLSDLSPQMLERAKSRLAHFNVDYFASAAEKIDSDKIFDAIFCSGAMHHFENVRQSIESMRDHLNPGGVLVVCEPIVWNPVNFIKAAKDRLEWNQFTTATRSNVARALTESGLTLKTNRVLHWRSGSPLGRRIWPYDKLGAYRPLDVLAVMYILAATTP